MHVNVRVPHVHSHTQTQQDGASLTSNPFFSSFTSLCVIKMLIETKSAKRYVITRVYVWKTVWTRCVCGFKSISHHSPTHTCVCLQMIQVVCVYVCVWLSQLMVKHCDAEVENSGSQGKSLIFICSDDSTVTSQITEATPTYTHTAHIKTQRYYRTHTHTRAIQHHLTRGPITGNSSFIVHFNWLSNQNWKWRWHLMPYDNS